MIEHILSIDLGGTHCRFLLKEKVTDEQWKEVSSAKYKNDDYPNFLSSVTHFVKSVPQLALDKTGIAVGLAGVVKDNEIGKTTNRDWTVSRTELKEYGFKRVMLFNDLEAAAWGVINSTPCDVIHNAPISPHHVQLVVGVGTGFGMAYVIRDEDGRVKIYPSEPGQSELIPMSDDLFPLWQKINNKHGHFSSEYILSGSGLREIYAYISNSQMEEISSAEIIQRATDKSDNHAVSAVRVFCNILSGMLGNLAILFRPRGGIHLVGGMVERTKQWVKTDKFHSHYTRKGRMADLISEHAVMLYSEDQLALKGAHLAMLDYLKRTANKY